MGVKHLMVSGSKSKCGRLVTQGTGADCKNCARVADAEAKWSVKPAADMVAVMASRGIDEETAAEIVGEMIVDYSIDQWG